MRTFGWTRSCMYRGGALTTRSDQSCSSLPRQTSWGSRSRLRPLVGGPARARPLGRHERLMLGGGQVAALGLLVLEGFDGLWASYSSRHSYLLRRDYEKGLSISSPRP